jgi:hypothetical protein
VTGTLYAVFVVAALICVVAGVTAVTRTRRRARDDGYAYGEDDGGATYAEEAAAVAAAEAAAAAQEQPERDGAGRVEDPGEAPPA